MNDKSSADTLARVAGRILEDAAFVFTDRMHNGISKDAAWNADGVSLSFTGMVEGTVHLWAEDGFARYVASNMLGIEPEAHEAAQKGMDALKELLNIIVGNFLTELYGTTPVFDLGLPKQLEPAALDADRCAADAVWLVAEGRVLLLTSEIKNVKK